MITRIALAFVLSFLLAISGCIAPGQQQASSGPPQGFIQNPGNPSQAWAVAPNGQHIPVQLASDGIWAGAPKTQTAPSKDPKTASHLSGSAPNRYTPMVDFLENHGLNLDDYGTLAKTYQASSVEDGRTKVKTAFLDSLKDYVGTGGAAELADPNKGGYDKLAQHSRNLRRTLNEVRVD